MVAEKTDMLCAFTDLTISRECRKLSNNHINQGNPGSSEGKEPGLRHRENGRNKNSEGSLASLCRLPLSNVHMT